MSDKPKITSTAASKTSKISSKRPSTINVATSSRTKIVPKDNNKNVSRSKKNANVDAEVTILNKEQGFPDFDPEYRQVAYGKFLRAMLEECLIDEKIEREETQMDLQMSQLADRFQKTMDQLDKTNRRLKDISFVVEQKRLLDLKNTDTTQFYEATDNSNAEQLLNNLSSTEQAYLDRLELKNVDFGFNQNSGHHQLLDAVNDAIEGLEKIKKDSNLDMGKFQEYEKSQTTLEDIEKDRMDLESLKLDFEAKFPKLSEQLLKEASEKIAKMLENDDENEGDD